MSNNYDKILVINFGSQYFHLIVKRLNALKIYSITKDFDVKIDDIKNDNIKGVILSGGPHCTLNENSPHLRDEVLDYFVKQKIPIFAICYGMQEIALKLKGKVRNSLTPEYSSTEVRIITTKDRGEEQFKGYQLMDDCLLFKNINKECMEVWMNHADEVCELPKNSYLLSTSKNCFITAFYIKEYELYAVQYHPEVHETVDGNEIFYNFVYEICKCKNQFDPIKYHELELEKIKQDAKDHYVIAAMSGGIDSTVAAAYTYKIFKDRFYGFFIDNGLLRKNEGEQVYHFLKNTFPEMSLTKVDASEIFLSNLKGVTDPEVKRKTIGRLFIEEFEKEVLKLNIDMSKTYLLQGTLYPDIIESQCSKNLSDTIKTHHNVGGLPSSLKFKLFEPFKYLFKDDVKKLAEQIQLPREIIYRHPFPGPGLAIRVIGEVDTEKLEILRNIDDIYISDLRKYGLYEKINQAFAVLLTTSRSVGIRGDARSYEYTCILRAVQTTSFMTANWYKIPYDILEKISARILNEVKGINKVLYDISSKPPSTIEFE